MSKIQALTSRLSALSAGERSWFWFSPDSPVLPMLLEPFAADNGMARLLRRAGSLPLPPGARACTGIAAVTDDGALQLASPLFEPGDIEMLAGWVRSNHGAHPALGRLGGATMMVLDGGGKVLRKYGDDSLWDGIRRPPVAGSLDAAAAVLDGLAVGADAWLWASEGLRRPVAVAVPTDDDPDGEAFAPLVAAGRVRAQLRHAGVRGIARRLSGGLLLTTADPLDRIGSRLSAWLAERGAVRLARLDGGEVVEGRRVGGTAPGAGCADQVSALQALASGETIYFWFSGQSKPGGPLLLLDADRSALKVAAMEAAADGAPSVRGKLATARWGIELQAVRKLPGFLPALAQWVGSNIARWPGLAPLVGARVTVRDRDGNITARAKDDDAWANLSTDRS